MRVILLGATGFVGRALLRRLAAGDEVRALVRRDAARLTDARATAVLGALPDVPPELFFEDAPHVVLHFATKQIDRDGRGFEENVRAMRALLGALPASCRGVIYGSSLSVYGPGPHEGVSEDAPLAPATALARARAECERVLFEGAAERGIGAYALRPRFVLGEGDAHTMPGLLRLARRGLAIGSGAQRAGIIDVDDYADIVLRLAQRVIDTDAPVQRALNVAYSQPVTPADVRDALAARFALPPVRTRVPVSVAATRLLARVPRAAGLATQLELVGVSQHPNVRRLVVEVGDDVVGKDPRSALRRAASLVPEELR